MTELEKLRKNLKKYQKKLFKRLQEKIKRSEQGYRLLGMEPSYKAYQLKECLRLLEKICGIKLNRKTIPAVPEYEEIDWSKLR